ncbi:MAG: glycosyltransferase family 2 protein [Streptosporangiaceae bacterium]
MGQIHPVWVAVCDLDQGGSIWSPSGPLSGHHRTVRALIRWHGAPVGYVSVPALPTDSLARRVHAAARSTLVAPLEQHATWDAAAEPPASHRDAIADRGSWLPLVACPQRFGQADGTGITVIVCTRDRSAELRLCLDSLMQLRHAPMEILVIDNAPTCDTTEAIVRQLAKRDPRIRYARQNRPGLSHARNFGLALASHEIVAFTDDDTRADPDWTRALLAGFAADPSTACVTGLVASGSLETSSERYFDARYARQAAFEPHRYDLASRPNGLYPYTAGIFGTGANFAVYRPAILKIGGFDPLLGVGSPGRGGEDLDIFLRLILAGERISYLPTALVWHRHRTDTRALREQVYSYGYGLGAYLAKHLATSDLCPALRDYGPRKAATLLLQMRHASQASGFGAVGVRLAAREVVGVLNGAARYWRIGRSRARSLADLP